jgi:hypothetical protein
MKWVKHGKESAGAEETARWMAAAVTAFAMTVMAVTLPGCGGPPTGVTPPEPPLKPPADTSMAPVGGAYHVHPGEDIQQALEAAATTGPKRVIVHAGTYAPRQPAQAMVWFNKHHDGITLEAEGEVILTAANPALADQSKRGYPAIVNHVVYFGDGISGKTTLRGFTITGANGFVTQDEKPVDIQPPIEAPKLEKGKFFYTDGGGIKIFGRSYPVIESVTVTDNFVSPCGAGISVEHRGYSDGSRLQSVQLRHCIFRNNRCPVSGSAVDLLHGSGAEIVNCLFIGNLSNEPMDDMAVTPGKWRPTHGSSALTLFPGSHVLVRRCTFTGNRNAIDDASSGNIYEQSIFWQNTAPGGWPPGGRYELDVASGIGVTGCFIRGEINDLRKSIDSERNVIGCDDPRFDAHFVPQAPGFESAGYRPVSGPAAVK